MRHTAKFATLAMVVALGFTTGCAAVEQAPPTPNPKPDSAAITSFEGVPDEWGDIESGDFNAATAVTRLEGDEFGVIVFGSGSCPDIATSFEAVDTGEVRVDFTNYSPYDACTADLGPWTHVFEIPETVTDRPVTVTVVVPGSDTVELTLDDE